MVVVAVRMVTELGARLCREMQSTVAPGKVAATSGECSLGCLASVSAQIEGSLGRVVVRTPCSPPGEVGNERLSQGRVAGLRSDTIRFKRRPVGSVRSTRL